MKWGVHPPYDQPAVTGLRIRGSSGKLLYQFNSSPRVFETFDEIPPLVVEALLFIENRELALDAGVTANPAIEWDRLGRAGLFYAGRKIGLPLPMEGGSTLAVQLEKYRHSQGGTTNSAGEKFRQIVGASLRSYRSGTDTRDERRRIILDYLNTLPLAAQVRHGEVHGLGEGLYAWFGLDLQDIRAAFSSGSVQEQARALKPVLALLCSVRAPSLYLRSGRDLLEARVDHHTKLMQENGILDSDVAERVLQVPLRFLKRIPDPVRSPYPARKHIDSIRTYLQKTLGLAGFYDLDRLHLTADTSIDASLQNDVMGIFEKLKDPAFIDQQGLRAERLIGTGDPEALVYSFTLFERTPNGNVLRAQADTLDKPFDLNQGMKMELGSTAKLRTLAHYLELVASLYSERESLTATDPITRWAAVTLRQSDIGSLEDFLQLALDREYSANTGEVFFTGAGAHTFSNFDAKDGGMLTIREAFRRSTNLVFIRLMRDLVRFHQARLPYDVERVLSDTDYTIRHQLLEQAADAESTKILARSYRRFKGLSEEQLVERMIGSGVRSVRRLSMLFFARDPEANANDLQLWLESRVSDISSKDAEKMHQSYDPARLNLLDYGYLLNRHPLELWCAGILRANPDISWNTLLSNSSEVRHLVATWLFKTKNRRAQDIRVRTHIEQDAFERMTPYWQRLGFPFESLVPSLATAIGSSSDRPIALAELMGIILNDGRRLPFQRVTGLHFAADTPYETRLESLSSSGDQVMRPAVARTLRHALADVVQNGTAQRLAGAFTVPDGAHFVSGGKTGSGDNRFNTYDTSGRLVASQSVNRTATFVFYVHDKYFGVVTAHVAGRRAHEYRFTSALPVTILKMLAPSMNARLVSSQRNLAPVVDRNSEVTANSSSAVYGTRAPYERVA
jgi:membrane peptidoglycan carboxypeptidase